MSENITGSMRLAAYICPYCSETNEKNFNIFEFSGHHPTELLCANPGCKEPCVTLTHIKDKFKVSVECPACGDVHTFNLTPGSLFLKPLTVLSCPECGIGIFFVGDEDEVNAALAENNDKISEIAEGLDITADNITVMYEVLDIIYSFLQEGKVFCSCGSCDIIPDVTEGVVTLTCGKCGNSVTVTPSDETLESLYTMEEFKF